MIKKIAQIPMFKLGPIFNNRVDTLRGFSKLKSKLSKDFHRLLPFNFCSIVYVGGCITCEFLLIEPVFS